MNADRTQRRAFTLVELLVVIGIIALLISILLPSLGRAQEQARGVQCMSQLRQIGVMCLQYTADNKGQMPLCGPESVDKDGKNIWPGDKSTVYARNNNTFLLFDFYMKTPRKAPGVWFCPTVELMASPIDGASYEYNYRTVVKKTYMTRNYNVNCGWSVWQPTRSITYPGPTAMKLNQIKRPTDKFVMMDGDFWNVVFSPVHFTDMLPKYVGNPGRVLYPHNHRANVLYFDFHAGQVGHGELDGRNLYLTQE